MFACSNFHIAQSPFVGMHCQHLMVELGGNYAICHCEGRWSISSTNMVSLVENYATWGSNFKVEILGIWPMDVHDLFVNITMNACIWDSWLQCLCQTIITPYFMRQYCFRNTLSFIKKKKSSTYIILIWILIPTSPLKPKHILHLPRAMWKTPKIMWPSWKPLWIWKRGTSNERTF